MPDAVVLVAVDVVVVVDAEPAQHRDLSPAPRLLPLTRFVNHLMDNIHPHKDCWMKVKVLLRIMFAIELSCVDCSLQM